MKGLSQLVESIKNFLNTPRSVPQAVGNTLYKAGIAQNSQGQVGYRPDSFVGKVVESTPFKVLKTVGYDIPKQAGQEAAKLITSGTQQTFTPGAQPSQIPFTNIKVPPKIAGPAKIAAGVLNVSPVGVVQNYTSELAQKGVEQIPGTRGTGMPGLAGLIAGLAVPVPGPSKVAKVEKLISETPKIEEGITKFTRLISPREEVPFKMRKFAETVIEGTKKPLAKAVSKAESSYYNPITNKDILDEATQLINTNLDEARRLVFDSKKALDAKSSAVGQLLIREAEKVKDYDSAARIAEQLVTRATSAGQGIQALSLFNKLSPEGILRFAASTIAKAQNLGFKVPPLNAEKAAEFVNQAKIIEGMADGSRAKILATAELMRNITELTPPSALRKIASLQTMAQLLNPKTIIRNLGGNLIFAGFENASKLVASGIDTATSVITGKRSVVGPQVGAELRGITTGFKQGAEEVGRGISIKNLGGKFEMSNTRRVFDKGILGGAEKALGYALQVPDRAFYQAAFDESLTNQAKVIAINEKLRGINAVKRVSDLLANPTEEMNQAAHLDGLYKTFQDENVVTHLFQGLKKAMNIGKEFGLGDFILKYPKTPANLLARAAEYTPLGFIKGAYEVVKPLITKSFDQKAFVESLGRATVGTGGLTALGSILYKAGILTSSSPQDKDLRAIEKKTGAGQYRINVSGLKRFVLGGFDPALGKLQPGDRLISYDWAQPIAPALALGAEITRGIEKKNKSVFEQMSGLTDIAANAASVAIDTLAEQPLVQGVKRFWGTDSPSVAIVKTLAEAPSSFIPTFISQVNQVFDNITKETYDPNIIKAGLNAAIAKIPILSAVLPARRDVMGDPMERYQGGSNNLFNVFINPAFVSQYLPTPEAKMVLDLYQSTGETKQIPQVVPNKLTVDGRQYKLNPDEYVKYQETLGKLTQAYFSSLASNPGFISAPEDGQVKVLGNTLSKLNDLAKALLFGIVKGKLYPGLEKPSPMDIPGISLPQTAPTEAMPTQPLPSSPGTTTFNRQFGGEKGRRVVARIRTLSARTPKTRRIKIAKMKVQAVYRPTPIKLPKIKIVKRKSLPNFNFA